MKIVREETIRRVREVLGGGPARVWGSAKLPPARITFVPFTLAEVEILPDERFGAPARPASRDSRGRSSAALLSCRSRPFRLGSSVS